MRSLLPFSLALLALAEFATAATPLDLPRIDLARYRIAESGSEPGASRLDDAEPGQKAKSVQVVYGDPDDDESEDDDGDVSACKVTPVALLGPWNSYDLTENSSVVHVSATEGVDPGGPEKRIGQALYFGVEAGQAGYASAPGYGNNWDQRAVWSMAAPNPALATNVRLRFYFNHDVEPAHDWFSVEANKGGTWIVLASYTGTNRLANGDFGPATAFDQTTVFLPADYTGFASNQIRLRLRVLSDAHGSDEDGLWPSRGAAQVDDIRVDFNGSQVSFASFDAPFGSDGWTPQSADFAGNFTKTLFLLNELDPCDQNTTCQISFVDDATPPSNPLYVGPGTGGSFGSFNYGPGAAVVNYTGGVSEAGAKGIHNVAVSERFAFGAPAPDQNGAVLRFDVWEHLPLQNGIFYFWHLRSRRSATGSWTPWRDFGMVYYSPGAPHYATREVDVSTLMAADPESVQVALGVVDLADELGLPGDDATPSPFFDNIVFGRYTHEGPVLYARDQDLFQDAFPVLGFDDYLVSASHAAVRLDAARDIGGAGPLVPGDSVVVRVRTVTPGTSLSGPPTMKWSLLPNAALAGAWRHPPPSAPQALRSGPCDVGSGVSGLSGSIGGLPLATPSGDSISGYYSFDLPDGPAHPNAGHQSNESPFFLAGDVLHYFIEAIDDQGKRTTIPEDTTGFYDYRACSPYDPRFTVRALPTVAGGSAQPELLVLNDQGHGADEAALLSALAQNGYRLGIDYDYYVVKDASAGHSNGIGSVGRGASLAQLNGYSAIAYFSGENTHYLLSDGSASAGHDKGNDLGLLTNWRNAPAPRSMLYFGDSLARGLNELGGLAAGYLATIMKVSALDDDVRDDVGGQTSPQIAPTGNGGSAGLFAVEAIAGACLASNEFDHVTAIAPAVAAHEFLGVGQTPGVYGAAASVWHQRTSVILGTPYPRLDLSFPISFAALLGPLSDKQAPASSRATLLGEALAALGHPPIGSQATDTGPAWQLGLEQNLPNPFNPRTEIRFVLEQTGPTRLRILDARGALVRELVRGSLEAGPHRILWDGQNAASHEVSSGVYFYELMSGGKRSTRKMVLLR